MTMNFPAFELGAQVTPKDQYNPAHPAPTVRARRFSLIYNAWHYQLDNVTPHIANSITRPMISFSTKMS